MGIGVADTFGATMGGANVGIIILLVPVSVPVSVPVLPSILAGTSETWGAGTVGAGVTDGSLPQATRNKMDIAIIQRECNVPDRAFGRGICPKGMARITERDRVSLSVTGSFLLKVIPEMILTP